MVLAAGKGLVVAEAARPSLGLPGAVRGRRGGRGAASLKSLEKNMSRRAFFLIRKAGFGHSENLGGSVWGFVLFLFFFYFIF